MCTAAMHINEVAVNNIHSQAMQLDKWQAGGSTTNVPKTEEAEKSVCRSETVTPRSS